MGLKQELVYFLSLRESKKPMRRGRGSKWKMAPGERGRHLCMGLPGDSLINETWSFYTTNIF